MYLGDISAVNNLLPSRHSLKVSNFNPSLKNISATITHIFYWPGTDASALPPALAQATLALKMNSKNEAYYEQFIEFHLFLFELFFHKMMLPTDPDSSYRFMEHYQDVLKTFNEEMNQFDGFNRNNQFNKYYADLQCLNFSVYCGFYIKKLQYQHANYDSLLEKNGIQSVEKALKNLQKTFADCKSKLDEMFLLLEERGIELNKTSMDEQFSSSEAVLNTIKNNSNQHSDEGNHNEVLKGALIACQEYPCSIIDCLINVQGDAVKKDEKVLPLKLIFIPRISSKKEAVPTKGLIKKADSKHVKEDARLEAQSVSANVETQYQDFIKRASGFRLDSSMAQWMVPMKVVLKTTDMEDFGRMVLEDLSVSLNITQQGPVHDFQTPGKVEFVIHEKLRDIRNFITSLQTNKDEQDQIRRKLLSLKDVINNFGSTLLSQKAQKKEIKEVLFKYLPVIQCHLGIFFFHYFKLEMDAINIEIKKILRSGNKQRAISKAGVFVQYYNRLFFLRMNVFAGVKKVLDSVVKNPHSSDEAKPSKHLFNYVNESILRLTVNFSLKPPQALKEWESLVTQVEQGCEKITNAFYMFAYSLNEVLKLKVSLPADFTFDVKFSEDFINSSKIIESNVGTVCTSNGDILEKKIDFPSASSSQQLKETTLPGIGRIRESQNSDVTKTDETLNAGSDVKMMAELVVSRMEKAKTTKLTNVDSSNSNKINNSDTTEAEIDSAISGYQLTLTECQTWFQSNVDLQKNPNNQPQKSNMNQYLGKIKGNIDGLTEMHEKVIDLKREQTTLLKSSIPTKKRTNNKPNSQAKPQQDSKKISEKIQKLSKIEKSAQGLIGKYREMYSKLTNNSKGFDKSNKKDKGKDKKEPRASLPKTMPSVGTPSGVDSGAVVGDKNKQDKENTAAEEGHAVHKEESLNRPVQSSPSLMAPPAAKEKQRLKATPAGTERPGTLPAKEVVEPAAKGSTTRKATENLGEKAVTKPGANANFNSSTTAPAKILTGSSAPGGPSHQGRTRQGGQQQKQRRSTDNTLQSSKNKTPNMDSTEDFPELPIRSAAKSRAPLLFSQTARQSQQTQTQEKRLSQPNQQAPRLQQQEQPGVRSDTDGSERAPGSMSPPSSDHFPEPPQSSLDPSPQERPLSQPDQQAPPLQQQEQPGVRSDADGSERTPESMSPPSLEHFPEPPQSLLDTSSHSSDAEKKLTVEEQIDLLLADAILAQNNERHTFDEVIEIYQQIRLLLPQCPKKIATYLEQLLSFQTISQEYSRRENSNTTSLVPAANQSLTGDFQRTVGAFNQSSQSSAQTFVARDIYNFSYAPQQHTETHTYGPQGGLMSPPFAPAFFSSQGHHPSGYFPAYSSLPSPPYFGAPYPYGPVPVLPMPFGMVSAPPVGAEPPVNNFGYPVGRPEFN